MLFLVQQYTARSGRDIRFKMSCVQKIKDFNLCSLTVWVQCDVPQARVKKKNSFSVVQNKGWHPYCPCSCYFTVALNMKLCTSEQMLFCLALGCRRFDEIRPSVSEASRSERCLPIQWKTKQFCAFWLGKPCYVSDRWFPQISILCLKILDCRDKKQRKHRSSSVPLHMFVCCF